MENKTSAFEIEESNSDDESNDVSSIKTENIEPESNKSTAFVKTNSNDDISIADEVDTDSDADFTDGSVSTEAEIIDENSINNDSSSKNDNSNKSADGQADNKKDLSLIELDTGKRSNEDKTPKLKKQIQAEQPGDNESPRDGNAIELLDPSDYNDQTSFTPTQGDLYNYEFTNNVAQAIKATNDNKSYTILGVYYVGKDNGQCCYLSGISNKQETPKNTSDWSKVDPVKYTCDDLNKIREWIDKVQNLKNNNHVNNKLNHLIKFMAYALDQNTKSSRNVILAGLFSWKEYFVNGNSSNNPSLIFESFNKNSKSAGLQLMGIKNYRQKIDTAFATKNNDALEYKVNEDAFKKMFAISINVLIDLYHNRTDCNSEREPSYKDELVNNYDIASPVSNNSSGFYEKSKNKFISLFNNFNSNSNAQQNKRNASSNSKRGGAPGDNPPPTHIVEFCNNIEESLKAFKIHIPPTNNASEADNVSPEADNVFFVAILSELINNNKKDDTRIANAPQFNLVKSIKIIDNPSDSAESTDQEYETHEEQPVEEEPQEDMSKQVKPPNYSPTLISSIKYAVSDCNTNEWGTECGIYETPSYNLFNMFNINTATGNVKTQKNEQTRIDANTKVTISKATQQELTNNTPKTTGGAKLLILLKDALLQPFLKDNQLYDINKTNRGLTINPTSVRPNPLFSNYEAKSESYNKIVEQFNTLNSEENAKIYNAIFSLNNQKLYTEDATAIATLHATLNNIVTTIQSAKFDHITLVEKGGMKKPSNKTIRRRYRQ